MLALLFASLSSLPPQEPSADAPNAASTDAPVAAAPTHPERWLPEKTLAAFVVMPVTDGSALQRLIDGDDAARLRALVTTFAAPQLEESGLPLETLARLLRSGVAIGINEIDARGVDAILVATFDGNDPDTAAMIADMPAEQDGVRTLGTGEHKLFVATSTSHIAIGTVAASVHTALDRANGAALPSLADDPDFAAAAPADGDPIARVFVRPRQLLTAIATALPPAAMTPFRRATEVLGTEDMEFAAMSWQLQGDRLIGRSQLSMPKGTSIVDALAGATGRIDASLARFVPASAIGYTFGAIDFGTLFEEGVALVAAAQPQAADLVDQTLNGIRQRTGIDLRADLFGGLGGRTIVVDLGAEGGIAALIELRQGTNFSRLLGKLLPMLPLQFETGTSAGASCWRATTDGSTPSLALAVVDSWLVVAGSDDALAKTVRQAQAPAASPAVLAFLRSLPPDATWASQGPPAWTSGSTMASAENAKDLRRAVLRRGSEGFLLEESVDAPGMLQAMVQRATAIGQPVAGGPAPMDTSSTDDAADAAAATTLRSAEEEGSTRANVTATAALLSSANPTVVARACWLLGEWRARESLQMLAEVATTHADAGVRLQAAAAIARLRAPEAAETLATLMGDADRRVRTVAAQAMGQLGPNAQAAPLLALLDQRGSAKSTEATDLVAALVVLHDIGDTANLLPAASAIGFDNPQVGQALVFLFQGLSPRLQGKDEVTTLLAVLDHSEPMLRRYAIQRLGELRDPSSARALEARLPAEGADLQPLVRVSLTQVRGESDAGGDDLVARAKGNVTAISQMVERRWSKLEATTQMVAIGLGAIVLLAVVAAVVVRRRSRRARAAEEARALVEPSAEYAEEQTGEWQEQAESEDMVGAGHGDRRY